MEESMMKKVLSIVFVLLMLFALSACGKDANDGGTAITSDRKLGLGSVNALTVDGTEKTVVKATVAAVVLDKDNKIVKCELDEAEIPVELKSGALQMAADLLTKDDADDSNWDSQVDAFCKFVEGKTGAEVAAIAVTDGKSSQIVGCDLVITDFIQAVKVAADNAKNKNIGENDDLDLALTVAKSYESTDAKPQFDIEMAAMTKGENGVITGCMTDSAQAKLTVENGLFTHAAGKLSTKREAGDNYGMKIASSIQKEWYEQADAFDAYAAGKTASDLKALAIGNDGKTDAISGCTMAVSGMLKNAIKAAD